MSLVSETRLDMDDHSQRFCRAKLQVNALLQQPEPGSVITRTPWTRHAGADLQPAEHPAPRGASSPAPRPNGRYAPPNQGNRLNESAQRGHPLRTHPLTHPGGDAPRRFMAQDTGYLLPREEGGNRGIGMTRQMNFAAPTLLA